MSVAPTTPKSNTPDEGPYASWLPRDIPYNSAFEDSVCVILTSGSPSQPTGLRILGPDSTEDAQPNISIRASDIALSTLPDISLPTLPLSLSDTRRKYASPIPGINLTHPGGYLEGGPGIAPSDDEFARHFVLEHKIRSSDELKTVLEKEMQAAVELAKERMGARKKAKEQNERLLREIKARGDQVDLETKVLSKAREKAREKRERRERRAGKKAG